MGKGKELKTLSFSQFMKSYPGVTFPDNVPLVSIRHPWIIDGINVYEDKDREQIVDLLRSYVFTALGCSWDEDDCCYFGDRVDEAYDILERIVRQIMSIK